MTGANIVAALVCQVRRAREGRALAAQQPNLRVVAVAVLAVDVTPQDEALPQIADVREVRPRRAARQKAQTPGLGARHVKRQAERDIHGHDCVHTDVVAALIVFDVPPVLPHHSVALGQVHRRDKK